MLRRVMTTLIALVGLPCAVQAAPLAFTDPVGDFLASYTGTQGGDLDVTSFDATFDGSTFTFTDMSNGNIGSTTGGIFVFGVNRGGNTAGFGSFRPGVLFDSVVVANPTGASSVVVGGVPTALPSGATTVSGNTISVSVPASLLPSNGFTFDQYQVNLWPRIGLGNNTQIADFAPDNSDVPVRPLPEPATFALLATGFAFAGFRRRKI